jgi:hypothetical protein
MPSAESREIAAEYIREKRLVLSVDPANPTPRANQSVLINIDYSKTDPVGLVLPLVFEIAGPTQRTSREFTLDKPEFIPWIPREGGRHKLMLREVAHNLWWGSLEVDVLGDAIDDMPQ